MIIEGFKPNKGERNREYWAIKKDYDERKPTYEKTIAEAKKSIAEIKHKHQSKATLRIAYIDGRVKKLSSIINKACELGISADTVFENIHDIAGLRIVVNNLKDVEPLIKELEAHPRFEIHDREEHGRGEPYIAVHLKASYQLSGTDPNSKVICEIQIRTLLQDSWAIITHYDLYKNQALLPDLAKVISNHLSDSLQTLDRMMDEFRKEIEAKVEPPNDLTDEAPIDKQGIAFLYYGLLGEKPQEYEVEFLMRKVAEYGLKNVGDARKGLSERVINKLKKIHDSRFPMLSPGNDLLEFGMLFAVKGPSAFQEYKKHIEAEWEEIEHFGRAEALSAMPDTFEEFVEMVESGDVPWEAMRELGGVQECMRCGTEIFVPDAAAEGVLDYYGFPATEVDLEHLLSDTCDNYECPFESESVNTSGVCPWCDHMMSKDD